MSSTAPSTASAVQSNWSKAVQLLGGGLTVSSSSTPALNGTYMCTDIMWDGIISEANAIALSGATPTFADGTTSLSWPDKAGVMHTFTPAQFHSFAMAVDSFVAQCAVYSVTGATAPSNAATIP
jgi:hypothetical protein